MLALFDTYDLATRELLRSLETAGVAVTPVFVRYDGDLPDGALCPFVTYTGIERKGEPLFFDEVPVPPWCEIRQGREPFAQILSDGDLLGRIHYEPSSFRQVERVDWLLPDGRPSHADHYDRSGNRYATTYLDDAGAAYQTVYRGPGEREIEVDHVSRVVTMRSAHELLTFESLTDFVSSFIDDQQLPDDRVLISSLSYPLFVMRKRAAAPCVTLFWQEPLRADLPGNMVTELEQPRALERIVFLDERQRRRVAEQHPGTPVDLAYLSHLGQFEERAGYDPRRAFTLTNTDQLPALEGLLAAFPDVTFAVAALTQMSELLHGLARRFPNLTLLPSATHAQIREELDRASVYLDINAGVHVLDVVQAAYHLDLVVLAVTPYVKAPDCATVLATAEHLTAALAAVLASPEDRARALDALHTQRGPLSGPDDYRRLLAPP